jgi:hypothetical protein
VSKWLFTQLDVGNLHAGVVVAVVVVVALARHSHIADG